jgi:8-oxo-dGTP diphosphatase
VSVKPWRIGVRGLILDPGRQVLLVRFDFPPLPWCCPGGGIEPGESDEHALRRELAEEVGLDHFVLGPCLWEREHVWDWPSSWHGQRERCYLVQVEPFDPQPRIDLAAERVTAVRWWTPEQVEGSTEIFGPRSFPALLRDLLHHGPPDAPLSIGK